MEALKKWQIAGVVIIICFAIAIESNGGTALPIILNESV